MNNEASFQRLAAVTSLLATLLACGSIGLQAVVLGINQEDAHQENSVISFGTGVGNRCSRAAQKFRFLIDSHRYRGCVVTLQGEPGHF